eukprot:6548756-Prymnesium_polylepis.1
MSISNAKNSARQANACNDVDEAQTLHKSCLPSNWKIRSNTIPAQNTAFTIQSGARTATHGQDNTSSMRSSTKAGKNSSTLHDNMQADATMEHCAAGVSNHDGSP